VSNVFVLAGKAMKAKKQHLMVALLSLGVLCFIVMTFLEPTKYSGSERYAEILDTGTRAQALIFSLTDVPEIEKVKGHAHSPFGVSGRDRYEYVGEIIVADDSFALNTKQYRPISVIELDGRIYCLSQHYFADSRFRWMSEIEGQFIQLQYDDVPNELARLRFSNETLTCQFRAWNLKSAAKAEDSMRVCELLIDYEQQSPRFPFLEDWQDPGKRVPSMNDFFRWQMADLQCSRGLQILKRIYSRATPSDDPQIKAALRVAIRKSEESSQGG